MTHADTLDLFDALATEMNGSPERFEPLGDVYLDLVCIMRSDGNGSDRVRLTFEGIRCTGVGAAKAGDEQAADCWLEGPIDAWLEMFADIRANGHATGLHTLNSLALLGDRIGLRGRDPMGVDKFHRFNQTLQEFFDGAARVAVVV
jgi:hypothetical protein